MQLSAKSIVLIGLAAAIGWQPRAALAQVMPPEQPRHSVMAGAVNVSTGQLSLEAEDVSVGSGEFPSRLTFKRTYATDVHQKSGSPGIYNNLGTWSHNFDIHFTCTCGGAKSSAYVMYRVSAIVFGKSYVFQPINGNSSVQTNPNFIELQNEGDTFRVVDPWDASWTYELITKDGVRVLFHDGAPYEDYDTTGRFANYVEFPDGQFIVLSYEASQTVTTSGYPTGTIGRLTSVVNSRGYGLRFYYVNQATSGNVSSFDQSKVTINHIQAFRTSCGAGTSSIQCSSGSLADVYYGYTYNNAGSPPVPYLSSFTDPIGNITKYSYNLQWMLSAVYKPSDPVTPALAVSYLLSDCGCDQNEQLSWVSSITDHQGHVTNYSMNAAPNAPASLSITYPDGSTEGYYSNYAYDYATSTVNFPMPESHTDGFGKTTTYSYDQYSRLVSETLPEGNVISQTLDNRSNVVELRYKAKPGSGLADRVQTSAFPACDGTNYRTCNKPIYTVDANGNRSDYQYDAQSGGPLVTLAPADCSNLAICNNLRAVTRYAYANFAPTSGIVAPPGVTLSQPRLLVTKDSCLSSTVTGTTVDFTYVCGAGSRNRELYNFTASTASAPTNFELESSVSDADQVAARISYTYDVVGNVLTQKGPRTDVDDTRAATFDAARRKIFEISADPDGTGALPRIVTHHVFDIDGNEIRTEHGVGNALNGSDFSVTHFTRKTYDPGTANPVKIEEVVP